MGHPQYLYDDTTKQAIRYDIITDSISRTFIQLTDSLYYYKLTIPIHPIFAPGEL